MSSTYSAESAASVSDSGAQECVPSNSSSGIHSAAPSSPSTGPTSPVTEISALSTRQLDLLMSSAAGSPVRTSASPERVLGSPVLARDYGRSTPELLARLDRDSSSWRTSQLSLLGGLTEFSETWPRSGLMRNGTAYRLPPLVPLTDATESGLLPTPAATSYGSNQGGAAGRVGPVRESLETMARRGTLPTPRCCSGLRSSGMNRTEMTRALKLWPTPTAGDAKSSGSRNTSSSRAHPGISLTDAVRGDGGQGRTFPTPASRDYRYPNAKTYSERGGGKKGEQLPNAIGGPLNPTWVEWLMGFPLEWTACAAWEMRSSRKSRKSSDGQS